MAGSHHVLQNSLWAVKEEPFARKKNSDYMYSMKWKMPFLTNQYNSWKVFFFSAFHLLTQVTAATGLWQQGQLHEAAELFRETIEGGKSLKKWGSVSLRCVNKGLIQLPIIFRFKLNNANVRQILMIFLPATANKLSKKKCTTTK